MAHINKKLRALFNAGKFAEVLKLIGNQTEENSLSVDLQGLEIRVIKLGCLTFLGKNLEIPPLLKEIHRSPLKGDARHGVFTCEAAFYEILDLIRRSEYQAGKKRITENLRFFRKWSKVRGGATSKEVDLAAFFVFQGLTFYRFYSGRFALCHKQSLHAFQRAVKANFKFGMCLSLDHIAHTECHLGEIRRGLLHFDEALAIAEELENPTLIKALQTSKLVYESQFGINLKNRESKLRSAIAKLNPMDTYSQAELILELSRLLLLKGKCDEAKELLDSKCESIYQHKNRRQSAKFHIRYANVMRFQGEFNAASTLLRSAIQNLDPAVDQVFKRQIEGLLRQIQIDSEVSVAHSLQKSFAYINDVDRRMSTRGRLCPSTSRKKGEDPIGDLVDIAYSGNKNFLVDLIQSDLLGLVPILLGRRPSEKIVLFAQKKGSVILFSQGNVHYCHRGLSGTMRALLVKLADGKTHSKSSLVEDVWGYHYRPDRHDALLHATIGKIRQLFGRFGSWIQFQGGGFQINSEVKVANIADALNSKRESAPKVASGKLKSAAAESTSPRSFSIQHQIELNHRQLLALSEFEKGWIVGVADYSKRFDVCTMTACRDLGQLYKNGHLQRMGRARATRYRILPASS